MAPFDQLIADVGSQFNIGPKAEALVQAAYNLIRDDPGGISGFLSKFESAGFDDQVASWLGRSWQDASSSGIPLSAPEVEKALGHGVISAIAAKFGLPGPRAGDAIAYTLPRLVGALTPGGHIPKAAPAATAGANALLLPKALARPALTQTATKSSAGNWAIPFFLIVLAVLLTYFYPQLHSIFYPPPQAALTPVAEAPAPVESLPAATPAPAPAPAPAAVAPPPETVPPPAPTAPAQLKLDHADGVLTYAGSVDSVMSRDSVVATLASLFGADHLTGSLAVDPTVAPPAWLGELKQALALFKQPNWHAAFDGSALTVGPLNGGSQIIAGLKSIFGPAVTITGGEAPAGGSAPEPDDRTSAALAALPPDFSGADLVAVLNRHVINFDKSSAAVPAASKPILRQAAALMKKLPPNVKVQIDGYTDATGDPAGNLALSKRRAEAVRALLVGEGVAPAMLRPKGHGPADATAGDKRSDRRIEFSAQ